MKKIITIIIAVICFPVVLCARQLTEQEAMERALQYSYSDGAVRKVIQKK